MLIQFSKNFL